MEISLECHIWDLVSNECFFVGMSMGEKVLREWFGGGDEDHNPTL